MVIGSVDQSDTVNHSGSYRWTRITACFATACLQRVCGHTNHHVQLFLNDNRLLPSQSELETRLTSFRNAQDTTGHWEQVKDPLHSVAHVTQDLIPHEPQGQYLRYQLPSWTFAALYRVVSIPETSADSKNNHKSWFTRDEDNSQKLY